MKVGVNVSKLQHVVSLYRDRGQHAMAELAPSIAESMHAEVLEVFDTEGYGKWPGFADTTGRASEFLPRSRNKDGSLKRTKKGKLTKRRRRKGTPKLLQDTGNLAGSMTPDWDEKAVEVYTNVRYAKFHVTGTRHMPKRDPFGIDQEAFEADVASMLIDHMTRPIAAE